MKQEKPLYDQTPSVIDFVLNPLKHTNNTDRKDVEKSTKVTITLIDWKLTQGILWLKIENIIEENKFRVSVF